MFMIKDHYSDSAQLEAAVVQRMGREIPDRVWSVLERRGDIADVRSGRHDINWLTERTWDLLELAGERVTRVDAGLPEGARVKRGDVQAVISLAAAYAAAKQDDVRKFREEVLGGTLMTLEDVKPWIEQQAKKDGRGTGWIKVLRPADVNPFEAKSFNVNLDKQPFQVSTDMLLYGVAGSDWQHAIPVATGKTLDRLRALSQQLAKDFDWDEAGATIFVLTGRTPWIPSVRIRVQPRSIRPRDDAPTYARGRISVEVDIAVTPNEVREHYRRIRKELLNGARTKRLSPKHLALAEFMVRQPEEESWETKRAAWNRRHPRDSYSKNQTANFKRDCRQALERLLAPRITAFRAFEWVTGSENQAQRTSPQRAAAKGTRRRNIPAARTANPH
jgi:hypothetical protein